MNKEILDLIIQIERSDFKDRLGHQLRDNKAYVNLVNKFKDSIDNKIVKPTHLEWLTPIEKYPRYDRCTIEIPDAIKNSKEVDTKKHESTISMEYEESIKKIEAIWDNIKLEWNEKGFNHIMTYKLDRIFIYAGFIYVGVSLDNEVHALVFTKDYVEFNTTSTIREKMVAKLECIKVGTAISKPITRASKLRDTWDLVAVEDRLGFILITNKEDDNGVEMHLRREGQIEIRVTNERMSSATEEEIVEYIKQQIKDASYDILV